MKELSEKRFFVLGGAGFVGSHLVDRALSRNLTTKVTVFDNFSTGRRESLHPWRREPRLTVIEGDAADLSSLKEAMEGHDLVVHLASEPSQTFQVATSLTQNVLEAMRAAGIKEIWFASGSSVYGNRGATPLAEDSGPWLPVSLHGASQLACEALVSAYQALYGWRTNIFRFANIVGARQTRGISFDFVSKLKQNAAELEILGDGLQSKSYLHIEDALEAMWFVGEFCPMPFALFNVAGPDRLSATDVAKTATEVLGLKDVKLRYKGGRTGWPGDVPVVQLDTTRLTSLGWKPTRNSKQAVAAAVKAIDAAH